jgi:hypothetical protein
MRQVEISAHNVTTAWRTCERRKLVSALITLDSSTVPLKVCTQVLYCPCNFFSLTLQLKANTKFNNKFHGLDYILHNQYPLRLNVVLEMYVLHFFLNKFTLHETYITYWLCDVSSLSSVWYSKKQEHTFLCEFMKLIIHVLSSTE